MKVHFIFCLLILPVIVILQLCCEVESEVIISKPKFLHYPENNDHHQNQNQNLNQNIKHNNYPSPRPRNTNHPPNPKRNNFLGLRNNNSPSPRPKNFQGPRNNNSPKPTPIASLSDFARNTQQNNENNNINNYSDNYSNNNNYNDNYNNNDNYKNNNDNSNNDNHNNNDNFNNNNNYDNNNRQNNNNNYNNNNNNNNNPPRIYPQVQNYPTRTSYNGKGTNYAPQIIMSKPIFYPSASQSQTSSVSVQAPSSNQIDAIEQGGIEIPDMNGIEYYELVNRVREVTGTVAGTVKDVVVKTPGTVATALQTVWRGSSNLMSQVAENMPEISMPSFGTTQDSYVAAVSNLPLPPFPYFRNSMFGKKPPKPIDSHWLDSYGV